jgi:hypothetical protein
MKSKSLNSPKTYTLLAANVGIKEKIGTNENQAKNLIKKYKSDRNFPEGKDKVKLNNTSNEGVKKGFVHTVRTSKSLQKIKTSDVTSNKSLLIPESGLNKNHARSSKISVKDN